MRGSMLLAAAVAAGFTLMPAQAQRLVQRTLTVQGAERSYWVAAPMDGAPAPAVVVVFHANGGTGDLVARRSRLHMTPNGRRWFVVYPNGLNQTWNTKDAADVEFTKAMVDAVLQSDSRIDKSRVYAAGAGSGGLLAAKLACEASDRFAAIATMAAGVPESLRTSCKPEQATPLLLVQGNLSRPETGGQAQDPKQVFDFWRQTFACTGAPATEKKEGGAIAATITTAKPCRDGAEIRLIAGDSAGDNPWIEEATREIYQFFNKFRRLPKF